MHVSAPRFKGKLKKEIAAEAFEVLGPDATLNQIDIYFQKNYKLPFCERSMYQVYKRLAQGKQVPKRKRYPRTKENTMISVIRRVRELANELGGYEALEDLINVIK
jgi:hypothetical protein